MDLETSILDSTPESLGMNLQNDCNVPVLKERELLNVRKQ